MRQRVAFLRTLLAGKPVLLLDEPFGSLDAARAEEILQLVERIRDTLDIPILLVSHDRAEVERLAGEVITLG
jgi:molybdate transport system ATP-binding protein